MITKFALIDPVLTGVFGTTNVPVDVDPVLIGVAGVAGFGVVVVPVLATTFVPYPFESSFVPFHTQEIALLGRLFSIFAQRSIALVSLSL